MLRSTYEIRDYRRLLESAIKGIAADAPIQAAYAESSTQCWLSKTSARGSPMRDHDVSRLTASELERARRELAASLTLARPDSPFRAPIEARMSAIDDEQAERARMRRDHGQAL